MTKKILPIVVLILLSIQAVAQESEFQNRLKSLNGVEVLNKLNSKFEKYELFINQPLDHSNKAIGTLHQRVIVTFRGYDKPTVMVTEGYNADYALYPSYSEEISDMLDANLVFCEHRYFGKSVPEPCDWQYMTVDNSCNDLHNIRQTFGKIFSGKWISTGISKGGSTCTYYRAAYPNDVDATVAYVAPISRAQEDGRHEKFLNKKVGTKEDRKKMHALQLEYMNRKDSILPMFKKYCENYNYSFSIPIECVYDYEILELEFSMWQWGTSLKNAPKETDNNQKWLSYLINVVDPDYFVCPNQYLPFFYQALRELGYYGYSTKHLGSNASIKSTKGYVKQIMVPQEMADIKFDPTVYKNTCKFLKQNDPTIIFIYGENDPWTASGVAPWLNCKKKQNIKIYIQPNGSHLSRINNMPNNIEQEIINQLKSWGFLIKN